MENKMRTIIPGLFLSGFVLFIMVLNAGCTRNSGTDEKASGVNQKSEIPAYKVTFIELGSVRCIPC